MGENQIPDLGTYTFFVLASYSVTILILVSLCILTVYQFRQAKKKLDKLNAK